MSRTFVATVVPAGNATGVEVPAKVVDALAAGKRPPVTITVNGHTWRSRVASKDGRLLIGISAANRAASADSRWGASAEEMRVRGASCGTATSTSGVPSRVQ